jgi:peptide/nickel transport system ATP-binding protein
MSSLSLETSLSGAVVPGGELLLSVRELSVEVGTARGRIEAVRRVSFDLRRGEAIGLVGESGSGKTLTCRAVIGALPPGCSITRGTIELGGVDLAGLDRRGWAKIRSTQVGAVFQDPASYLNPSLPVGEQLAEVIRVKGGRSRAAARARALELLATMHLHRPVHVYQQIPAELSGGMLQRVMIAIAVACDPVLLVADEATTALDLTTQREVIDLLSELRDRLGLAVLFVSHDLAAVAELCDQVAVFYAGEVVEIGETSAVISTPSHPYTEALLRVGSLAADGATLDVIPGHHPRLGEAPTGCRFAPRCAHQIESCGKPVPLASSSHGGQVRCLRSAELELSGADLQ